MRVEAIALSGFQHGDISAIKGEPVKHRDGQLITDSLAADLERAGLVRIKTAPQPKNPKANAAAAGKAADAGAATPSSVSRVAPASPKTARKILTASKPGAAKTKKRGT